METEYGGGWNVKGEWVEKTTTASTAILFVYATVKAALEVPAGRHLCSFLGIIRQPKRSRRQQLTPSSTGFRRDTSTQIG